MFSANHCQYDYYRCQWKRIRDVHAGQELIKKQRTEYLPPTVGMANRLQDGKLQWDPKGIMTYENYLMRALFSGDMAEMVRTAIGILWNKDATVEVPKKMEYIKENATSEGDSILQLMRDVNVEQLLPGRTGLLADLPTNVMGQPPQPYITRYDAERIINWDIGARGAAPHRMLNLVVLDETEDERQPDLSVSRVEKYLVLSIGNLDPNDTTGDYYWGRFRGVASDNGSGLIATNTPVFSNTQLQKALIYGSPLPFIPFTFINSTNISHKCEAPPHVDLADLILSLYLNSADIEQTLHGQAQETLVIEGGEEKTEYAVGVNAVLTPRAGNKAYWIGLNGSGLAEAQKNYQNKRTQIERKSGQMIDTRSLQRESGESLKTRLAAQTATLSMIARACGWGMTRCLQQIAVMKGLDPKEVTVKPNVNFLNPELFAKTLVELMQAKNMGLPLTNEDLVRLCQERGVTDKDFETVMKILKLEPTAVVTSGQPTANPTGKEPTVVEGESAKIAAKAKAANPTGVSARGNTRNPSSKSK